MIDYKAQRDLLRQAVQDHLDGIPMSKRLLSLAAAMRKTATIETPEVRGCGKEIELVSKSLMSMGREPCGFVDDWGNEFLCPDCQPKAEPIINPFCFGMIVEDEPEPKTPKPLGMPESDESLSRTVGKLWNHVVKLTDRINEMGEGK